MNVVIKKLFMLAQKPLLLIETAFDKFYLAENVPTPAFVSHANWRNYLYEAGNKEGMNILEIGSREVTGKSTDREKLQKANYTGFDFYHGRNVDVVGDAHKLSTYFEQGQQFDIIYSSACFEHFAMPWVVAVEIAKLLKVGGLLIVETHFSFIAHERPWNFFQFSDMALKTLFSPALGFECIDVGMSNPIVGRFSSFADDYLKNKPLKGLYCHSEFLGRKIKEVENFNWSDVNLNDVVGETKYPSPKPIPNRPQ